MQRCCRGTICRSWSQFGGKINITSRCEVLHGPIVYRRAHKIIMTKGKTMPRQTSRVERADWFSLSYRLTLFCTVCSLHRRLLQNNTADLKESELDPLLHTYVMLYVVLINHLLVGRLFAFWKEAEKHGSEFPPTNVVSKIKRHLAGPREPTSHSTGSMKQALQQTTSNHCFTSTNTQVLFIDIWLIISIKHLSGRAETRMKVKIQMLMHWKKNTFYSRDHDEYIHFRHPPKNNLFPCTIF